MVFCPFKLIDLKRSMALVHQRLQTYYPPALQEVSAGRSLQERLADMSEDYRRDSLNHAIGHDSPVRRQRREEINTILCERVFEEVGIKGCEFRVITGEGASIGCCDAEVLSAFADALDGAWCAATRKLAAIREDYMRVMARVSIDESERYRTLERNLSAIEKVIAVFKERVLSGADKITTGTEPLLSRRSPAKRFDSQLIGADPSFAASKLGQRIESVRMFYRLGYKAGTVSGGCRWTANATLFAPSSWCDLMELMKASIHFRAKRVLVLGSGNGIDTALFSLISDHVTGIEIDPHLYREGSRCIKDLSRAGIVDARKVTLLRGDFFRESWQGYDLLCIYWPFTEMDSVEYAVQASMKIKSEASGAVLLCVPGAVTPEFPSLKPVAPEHLWPGMNDRCIHVFR